MLYATSDDNATFSYQRTWPCQFQRYPRFSCTPVNLAGGRAQNAIAAARIRAWRGDAVVMLHSVFSNVRRLGGWAAAAVRHLSQPKVFFIGNEYKLMPEKMAFCDELSISLLVSQSTSPAVHALYAQRLRCRIIGIPNSGLDEELFRPTTDRETRPIDLGYRADDSPWYLGHQERRLIADYFVKCGGSFGLTTDISLDRTARLTVPQWAAFLNRCRGQLGTEAGGDFFELTDATRNAVGMYLESHRNATFDEVWKRFFADYHNRLPLRIISSRHVEAAGTRTVQLLFEGHYDGFLWPDVHYIPLKKDFSNVADAVAKFRDAALCRSLADNAYRMVRAELTYDRLLARFETALVPLLS